MAEFVTVAVEGVVDAVVAQRMLDSAGLRLARAPIITGGKGRLDRQLAAYNNASRHSTWLVLRDMDHDALCAAALHKRLMPQPSEGFVFRIAVRSIESWLIADRKGIAKYLGVPADRVPLNPERLASPKRTIVSLAKRSRSESLRRQMAPARGSIAQVGPGYTALLSEFALEKWDPAVAADASKSLDRAVMRLRGLRA